MKLIILDRDGVINKKLQGYVKNREEFCFIDGSIKAIANLLDSNYRISVCSNQRGVALGLMTRNTLEDLEHLIEENLRFYTNKVISAYHYCTHNIDDTCNCRKPQPGLLNEAIKNHSPIEKSSVTFVGDSYSDYLAASAANINFVLLRTGNGKKTENLIPKSVSIYDDLISFVSVLLTK